MPNRRSLTSSLLFASALIAATSLCTPAQKPSPNSRSLAFDVVSIRPDPSPILGRDQVSVTPNGWRMAHESLLAPLLAAYVPTTSDSMMYTVSTLVGIPDWMRTQLYEIDAKVSESDLAAWENPATQPAMLRSMLQTMLADRCKLTVHRSSKEVNVYWLVAAKNGPRLKSAAPGDPHPGATEIPGGGELISNDGTGTMSFYASPMKALGVVLSNFAGRPVVDKTGLTGLYDMSFRRPRPGAPSTEPDSGADAPPSIFEVVQNFGLKLEPAKSSVETLVIDHIDRPSDN